MTVEIRVKAIEDLSRSEENSDDLMNERAAEQRLEYKISL